jgi:hypothetical protein
VGLEKCRTHAKGPQAGKVIALAKAERQIAGMRKFTTPIDPADWEANPLNSLDMEFRRTIAHIRYYEEKIAEMKESEHIFGVTSVVNKGATEFTGTDVTSEAKPHIYVELLFRERRHLHEMHKTFVAAGIAVKREQVTRELVDRIEIAMDKLITALGKDPQDPEIRNTARLALLGLSAS